jgi:1-deoxy-D-xylulose-5-phosphate reductoisomerase
MSIKQIAVLGSTGSIGTQTLDVVKHHPHRFKVCALAAGKNIELLKEQVVAFQPVLVAVDAAEDAIQLDTFLRSKRVRAWTGQPIEVMHGEEGRQAVASMAEVDLVVCAIVGSAGLASTLAAIHAGKTIGLANKETLVTAGHLVTQAIRKHGNLLLPIDSEHSAIFQCLNGERRADLKRIVLTASGGALRDLSREQLVDVTVERALAHPNWSMGAKITIDSATMLNKGLEVIEAHWLFDLPYHQIDVVMHPQSIVHSMVEFRDTSVMAQLGCPDMRVPIQYALTYPERLDSPATPLDLIAMGRLDFRAVDFTRFPCLAFAYAAGREGGTMPAVLNAANEVAVARFLNREIPFPAIEQLIERAMQAHQTVAEPDLQQILHADAWTRAWTEKLEVI